MANQLTAVGRDAQVIREELIVAVHGSLLSREEIAERMSALLGIPVTVRQLNGWTAESREDLRFPLQHLCAFCEVLEDWSLLRAVCGVAGFYLADKKDQVLMQLGKAYADLEAAKKLLAEVAL